jgi:hypothetical protein
VILTSYAEEAVRIFETRVQACEIGRFLLFGAGMVERFSDRVQQVLIAERLG